MKKLATLLLAAGMVVASNAPASAADVKVDGFHMITFERHNSGFKENASEAESFLQRTRLGLSFAASENLSGYLQFQMGTDTWGEYTKNKHGNINAQTRLAYFDWKIPATSIKVRMGRQTVGLPSEPFGGNAVMGANWGARDGVAVQAPVTDWLDINAFWVRAAHKAATVANVDQDDNTDVFGIAAPLKFDGVSVTPWIAYAAFDDGNTGDRGIADTENVTLAASDADLYWAGASATISAFDPFTLKLAAAYGKANYADETFEDRDGWYVQAKASYKLGFGTPVLGAWYGSGDDDDVKELGEGMIPMINGYFTPTTTFYNGGYGLGNDMALEGIAGTWGVQAGIEGVSFLSDLSHDFTVTYIGGTHDKANAATNIAKGDKAIAAYKYLTTEDSVVEFDFNTTYNIYKNLQANLEIAYLISDFGTDYEKAGYDEDDWRVALTFLYKF